MRLEEVTAASTLAASAAVAVLQAGSFSRTRIASWAVLRLRCAWPIHLEKRAGDVRHSQLVPFQYAPRFLDFLCVQLEQVLVPHAAQLDPFHAKFLRSYFAHVAKSCPISS